MHTIRQLQQDTLGRLNKRHKHSPDRKLLLFKYRLCNVRRTCYSNCVYCEAFRLTKQKIVSSFKIQSIRIVFSSPLQSVFNVFLTILSFINYLRSNVHLTIIQVRNRNKNRTKAHFYFFFSRIIPSVLSLLKVKTVFVIVVVIVVFS